MENSLELIYESSACRIVSNWDCRKAMVLKGRGAAGTGSLRFCRIDRSTLSKIGWLIFEFRCQCSSQNMFKIKANLCLQSLNALNDRAAWPGMGKVWIWSYFGLEIDNQIQISVNLFCWESTYLSYRNAGYSLHTQFHSDTFKKLLFDLNSTWATQLLNLVWSSK